MELNRLLQKQVKKNLTSEQLADPSIQRFLSAINDSYHSFERDKELLNHAFSVSEHEYQKLYEDLNQAHALTNLSIDKLKGAVGEIAQENEIEFSNRSNDLLSVVEYLNIQIHKRKETESSLSRTLNLLKTLLSKLNSGILVEDEHRKILFTNKLFCDIFSIAVSPENMIGADCSDSAEQSLHLFNNAESFIGRINDILKNRVPVFGDLLEMNNGRILERDYIPIYIDGEYKGHLWDYADVTERKTSERRLTEITNLQNAILNGTDYSIIYTDTKGIIRSFNRGAENMLGYTAGEVVDVLTPAVFHDDFEVKKKAIELSAELGIEIQPGFDVFTTKCKSQPAETNEWTYVKKNGDRLAILLTASAIRNSAGEISGYLGIARDITVQKKAQQALELSEERYRNIVEKSTDVIYKSNKAGCFTYVNPVAERVTGYSQDELLGKHFLELIRDDKKQAAADFYRSQVLEKKRTTYYEFPIVTREGKEIWIGQSVQLSEIGNNDLEFTSLAIDITERKNYERSIYLQNEKYRNIITNMNLGLLEVDLDERVQFANQGFLTLSGYDISEIIGKKASDLFVSDKHAKLVQQKTAQRSKGLSDMYEISVNTKKGEQRWWMISGAPNYNDKGQLIGSIGIHLDITEKKQLELALESAKARAEESSRAKASFLANMSHEIRTPLNGIIGMIRELYYEGLPDKQMKYLDNASVASQHLLSVLNNILDISKIEAGELNLEQHHFRLKDTVKEVKSIMMARAREKGLLLNLNVHEIKDLTYIGDSARIRQILLNLIGNAIKFTSTGGIFVECVIRARDQNLHTVSITVEDTGIGMDENYQKDLFRKFSQEDSSTSRKYGGTGLGMAITNEIVQLMGGSIHVNSVKGKGTAIELVFNLPVGDGAKIKDEQSRLILRDLSHVRILLVEDNEFNRLVACNTLGRFKCQVTQAENGQVAIGLLEKNKFDLVLMDLQMPVMDGFETTRTIREKLGLELPIIALTANAFKSELERCVKIGMNDYVTKPFEEEKLMGVILKQLRLGATPLQIHTTVAEPTITAGKLYNLDKLIALTRNDNAYVQKMIGIFIEQTSQAIDQIQKASGQSDLESLYQVAHKIKPSLGSMGVDVLYQTIRDVEQKAIDRLDTPELKKQVDVLVTTLQQLIEQLKLEQK
jgi:PAS domain S-box-containing protein